MMMRYMARCNAITVFCALLAATDTCLVLGNEQNERIFGGIERNEHQSENTVSWETIITFKVKLQN